MKKRNHIIFGFAFVILFLALIEYFKPSWFSFNALSAILLSCLIVFYSLLPDIDHKNSTITWFFFGMGVLGLVLGMLILGLKLNFLNAWILMILSTSLLVFTYLAVNLFEHRGVIHSVPVGLLAVMPIYFILHSLLYCSVAYLAWNSHLIGDGYLFKLR